MYHTAAETYTAAGGKSSFQVVMTPFMAQILSRSQRYITVAAWALPHKSCERELSPCCERELSPWLPKKAHLTEIRPQKRQLPETNLFFWICWHQINIHSPAEALSNLWSWFAKLSCNDEDGLLHQHLYWISDLTWIDPKWKQGKNQIKQTSWPLLPGFVTKLRSCIYLLSHITILLHLGQKEKVD